MNVSTANGWNVVAWEDRTEFKNIAELRLNIRLDLVRDRLYRRQKGQNIVGKNVRLCIGSIAQSESVNVERRVGSRRKERTLQEASSAATPSRAARPPGETTFRRPRHLLSK